MPFPLAPMKEQHRIVVEIENQLARIEAGMHAVLQIEQKAEPLRRSMFDYAFSGRLSGSGRNSSL